MYGVFSLQSMKNYWFCILLLTALYACKKKDMTLPVITLAGETNIQQILNTQWTDPGYNAADNIDGDITQNVIVNGTVNKDFAGTYIITYTVADNEGNETSVQRSVTMYNEAKYLSGKYSAHDTCPLTSTTFTTTITPSNTINKEFTIENFGNWNSLCPCIAAIKMKVSGSDINSFLFWDKQEIANNDSLITSSNGGIISTISPPTLSFSYQWKNSSSTTMCSGTYTHQ